MLSIIASGYIYASNPLSSSDIKWRYIPYIILTTFFFYQYLNKENFKVYALIYTTVSCIIFYNIDKNKMISTIKYASVIVIFLTTFVISLLGIYESTLAYFEPIQLNLYECGKYDRLLENTEIECKNRIGNIIAGGDVVCNLKTPEINLSNFEVNITFTYFNGTSQTLHLNNSLKFIIPENTTRVSFIIYSSNPEICLNNHEDRMFLPKERFLNNKESFMLYVAAYLAFLMFLFREFLRPSKH